MIKVAIISGDSSPTGVPSHVFSLATGLDPKKFEVLVLCPPGFLCKKCAQKQVRCKEIPMGGIFDRRAEGLIREELEKFRPDIVHFHGMRAGWLGRLAARKMQNVKKIYSEHLWTKDFHLSNPAYEKIQLEALKFLDRWTDKTLAVSKPVADFLLSRGFNKNKIIVIPNGIKQDFLDAKPIEKPKEMPIVLGSVGSLNDVKNYRNIILAVAKIKAQRPELNVHYQIIGEGPEEKRLKNLAKNKKIEEIVHFIGRTDSVVERLRHFSIFINASKSESFGLAVGEAMAVGLPVVVSKIPALESLVGSKAGILINPKDSDSIVKAVLKLIDDPKLRSQMGREGKKRITTEFSEQKMIQRISELYLQILGSGARSQTR